MEYPDGVGPGALEDQIARVKAVREEIGSGPRLLIDSNQRLDETAALRLGRALAYVSKRSARRHKILIGKDTRLSGYMLETAMASGICSMGVDVLLVDDIQFLSGKVQTQEEFFHTFNTLHNANKQIVITSDMPPKQLQEFEDRMRSRFEWGLITDVQPPDLETRIAILRKKTLQERLTVPADVLEFIASKISTNIRELEGALIRVTAFANLNRQPVDLALAEIVLKDLIPDPVGPEITAKQIMEQTAVYYGVTIDDLCGGSRSRVLVTARQIAMYLCRELTDLSLPKIGQQFGGRDHTTVMHAIRQVDSKQGRDDRLRADVERLQHLLQASPAVFVTLIERRGAQVARGVAYGTAHAEHLLNVRAGNMSAMPDDPGHFVRWLEARGVEVQVQLIAGLPAFNVVGLGDKAVAESRERVRGAIAAIRSPVIATSP